MYLRSLIILTLSLLPPATDNAEDASEPLALTSPDGRLRVIFQLGDQEAPEFEVTYRDIPVASGTLGLAFADSGPLRGNLKVVDMHRASR